MPEPAVDFVARYADLAITLATRFAPLTPELLQRHRRRLDRNVLAQNGFVAQPETAFPTEDPRLDESWRQFRAECRLGPGEARAAAFFDAQRARLEARYVTGYRMLGRDWEAGYQSGWELLASVTDFDWTEAVIAAQESRLDFARLSANRGVPWTQALLARFEGRWDWDAIARNEAVPWSESLLALFPEAPLGALSGNRRFPWTEDFLARNAEELDWRALCRNPGVPWTEALAERFASRISWHELAANPSYPSPEDLLARRGDLLDWEALCASPSFAWSPSMLRRFGDRIAWRTLSANAPLWTADLLSELVDRIDFGSKGLSGNSHLQWTKEIIERHSALLDRNALARNPAVWSGVFAPLLDMAALDALLTRAPAKTR